MNKIRSIYPTEIAQIDPPSIKYAFNNFGHRLDSKISQSIALRKNQILLTSKQMLQNLNQIKQKSAKYSKKIYQQQMEFKDKIESLIQYDIRKWQDYQSFFKSNFEELEENLRRHKAKNSQLKKKIQQKQVEFKYNLQQQIFARRKVNSLISLNNLPDCNLTTKESTLQLSYSHSIRQRIKTEQSLPMLKPLNQQYRIKTIQSQLSSQDCIATPPKRRRNLSYLEPIKSLRKKEESSLPLLMQLLQWYKLKNSNNLEQNWFLKILYNKRHYSKLLKFIQENSHCRKISVKV